MQKLSQKELLREGFGTELVKGLGKLGLRTAWGATKMSARALSPKAVDIVSKGSKTVTDTFKKSFAGMKKKYPKNSKVSVTLPNGKVARGTVVGYDESDNKIVLNVNGKIHKHTASDVITPKKDKKN